MGSHLCLEQWQFTMVFLALPRRRINVALLQWNWRLHRSLMCSFRVGAALPFLSSVQSDCTTGLQFQALQPFLPMNHFEQSSFFSQIKLQHVAMYSSHRYGILLRSLSDAGEVIWKLRKALYDSSS